MSKEAVYWSIPFAGAGQSFLLRFHKRLKLSSMKKSITLICFLSSFLVQLNAGAQIPAVVFQRLNTVLDSTCARYKLKGTSAAIIVPGMGTWKRAYGISSENRLMSSNMLLGLGSNTKTYIACTLLKLQEQGLLDLDDSIGKWIGPHPFISGKITVRQLLNHSSGIFSYTSNPNFNDSLLEDITRIWTAEETLQLVNDTPGFKPGMGWNYSNSNFLLAGIIIQKVLNKPIEQCLRDVILQGAGLSKTILFPQEQSSLDIAHPWTSNNPSGKQQDMLGTSGSFNQINSLFSTAGAAGGMMATAEDNARFWSLLGAGQLISKGSMDEMTQYINIGSTGSVNKNISYGLGIFRYQNLWGGHTILTHGGTIPGYIAENALDSVTGVAISVLSNQDSIDNSRMFGTVVRALHAEILKFKLSTGSAGPIQARIQLDVYPNPCSEYLHIHTPVPEQISRIVLYNLEGKQVQEQQLQNNHAVLSTASLPAGLYLLHGLDEQGTVLATHKIAIGH